MNNIIKRIIFSITAVLILIAVLCLSVHNNLKEYKEKSFTFSQLTENNAVNNFTIKDNRLIALTDDPGILYTNNDGIDKVKSVTIYVNYLSDNYTFSEIYLFNDKKEFERKYMTLTEGTNYVDIDSEYSSQLRFDLLTKAGSEIGIDKIVINEHKSIIAHNISSILDSLAENSDNIMESILLIALAIFLYMLINGRIHCSLRKAILLPLVMILSFCIVNIGVAVLLLNETNPEKKLDFDDITGNLSALKDFEITEGRLKSVSNDPWIYYYDNNIDKVRTVTLNVSYMSQDSTDCQLFSFYENDENNFINIVLHEGSNNIVLDRSREKKESLRFDLTSVMGLELGIDSIVLNERALVRFVKASDIIKLYTHIIIWLIFVFAPIVALICSRKIKPYAKLLGFMNRFRKPIMAFGMLLIYFFSFYSGVTAILPVIFMAVYLGQTVKTKKLYGIRHKFLLVVMAIIMFILLPRENIGSLLIFPDNSLSIGIFISALISQAIMYSFVDSEESRLTVRRAVDFAVIYIMTVLPEIFADIYLNDMLPYDAIITSLFARNVLLNTLLLGVLYYLFKELLGGIIGRIAVAFIYFVFIVGSFVKMKYHNTIFSPVDILQIKDFMSVVTRYVPAFVIYMLAALIIAAIVIILYKNRKTVARYKPDIYMAVVVCIMTVSLTGKLRANAFINTGADLTRLWAGVEDCVNEQGVVAYSYIKFKDVFEIMPKADENYSKEYMTALKKEADSLHNNTVSDEKPNVILIMEESMFDVSRVPDINISTEVDGNIKKYEKAMSVSPKYGGLTSTIEFEALTGFSNYFFLDTVVPYITYWDSEDDVIPSIASEFNKNGYNTTAIHPNEGTIYNRDIVYNAMGFKKFIDKDDMDFSPENLTVDSYFKDSALADVIKTQLDSSDEPQFIFTVTIENHMLYDNKYNDTEVKVTSDKVGGTELHQLEQYTQGVLSADRFIEKMVDIVDNAKRPTIMYVWGDHLPPLTAFNTLGYIDDKYSKYTTPIVAYSNYKDINIDSEYISPAQLAPQVLRDAGVEYSSYFDYIYSLRSKYPVVHKEFGIDENDEDIIRYGEIQYDVLFGEGYMLEDNSE